MGDEKKTFTIPEAKIILFANDDIIVTSGGLTEDTGDSNWDNDDNGENFN